MNRQRMLVSLILLATTTAGCGETPRERLFVARQLVTAEGKVWPYAVFLPENRTPGQKLPVILFLNGWGENGTDGLRQISNNLGGDIWRMRGHFPFLAVCPQCAYNGSWDPGSMNATMAMAVLDQAIAEFHGDPDRVAISGPSAGGQGAQEIALAHPERFSAVVPISSPLVSDVEGFRRAGLPVWNFVNSRDIAVFVSAARQGRRQMLEAGLSPLVTEFDEAGHNAWDNAYSSPALHHWLLEQSRENRGAQRGFQLLSPGQIVDSWSTTAPGVWNVEGDTLECKADSEAANWLIGPVIAGDFEAHWDAELLTGSTGFAVCDATGAPRMQCSVPRADAGLGTWQDPSGRVIAPLDVVGQRGLMAGWNDLRLSRKGARLRLVINGWFAGEVEDPNHGENSRFALGTVDAAGQTRVRFVRLKSQKPLAGISRQP